MFKLLTYLCILLNLSSCTQADNTEPRVTTFSELAMGIPYRVSVGKALSRADTTTAYAIIQDTFDEVNDIYNNWNPNSEISKINNAASGVRIPLSNKLEKLLRTTQTLVSMTEGRFDPTVAPLCKLWKSSLQQGLLPETALVKQAQTSVGWNKLHFEEGFIIKENDGVSLDLCGVAKGYCVDLLVENLVDAGYPDVYVEWGGEIRTAGHHPDIRPWTVFISHLDSSDPSDAVDIVQLKNNAIATSGNYLQNWLVNGRLYTHIINPESMNPLEVLPDNICSVTVKAPSCVMADVLATAAMIFPSQEEAKRWADELQKQNPEIIFWFQ